MKLRLFKFIANCFDRYYTNKYRRQGRWYARYLRYSLKSCGSNLIIAGKPRVFCPQNISVGNNVRINDGVQLSPQEGHIYIGDYVTFSRGAQVVAGSLDTSHWKDEQYKNHIHTFKDVHIGEGTWLSINSIILPGVSISGKGVIVAAGAVVTKNVDEDYVIVGGCPAKIIKRL